MLKECKRAKNLENYTYFEIQNRNVALDHWWDSGTRCKHTLTAAERHPRLQEANEDNHNNYLEPRY